MVFVQERFYLQVAVIHKSSSVHLAICEDGNHLKSPLEYKIELCNTLHVKCADRIPTIPMLTFRICT